MKSKKVVYTLVGLSVFVSASCLFATYLIQNNELQIKRPQTQTQIQLKNELQKRLESQQEAFNAFSRIDVANQVAFNEMMADFPIRDYIASFEQEMSRMFDQVQKDMNDINNSSVRSSSFMVEETDKEYRVSAIIKNATKEELKVQIHRGFLTISAEDSKQVKTIDEKSKDDKSAKTTEEVGHSQFKKVLKLPKNVEADKAEVTFKDDVLLIVMPIVQVPEEKPVTLEIK
jgi:HSP20 family protein